MTIRTVFSTLFIFVLPLLMLGCDGGGSAMEQEPQQMEELKLSIYHPPESNAQKNTTINRAASELQSDDLLNIFVTGDNEREALGVVYPEEGQTTETVFTVPAGNYDVDLLGFRQITDSQNSAVVFATTGTGQSVDVNAGEVTEVNFSGGPASQGGLLSKFDLSFEADFEFTGNGNGNGAPRQLDVTLTSNGQNAGASNLAGRIFDANNPGLGGVGFDPDGITQGDRTTAEDNADFTSISGSTLSTDEKALKLSPGSYGGGGNSSLSASVLLQLQISNQYVGDNQSPVYLYNNVNGNPEDDVNLGDDGGIIVII